MARAARKALPALRRWPVVKRELALHCAAAERGSPDQLLQEEGFVGVSIEQGQECLPRLAEQRCEKSVATHGG